MEDLSDGRGERPPFKFLPQAFWLSVLGSLAVPSLRASGKSEVYIVKWYSYHQNLTIYSMWEMRRIRIHREIQY